MGFFHSAFYFAGRRRGTHTTSISMHRTHADFLSISVGRIVSETAAKTKKNQRTNGYSWESIECICPCVALFYFSTHARTRLDGYFSATPWLIRFLLVRLCFFLVHVFGCVVLCVRCPYLDSRFALPVFFLLSLLGLLSVHYTIKPIHYTQITCIIYIYIGTSLFYTIFSIRCVAGPGDACEVDGVCVRARYMCNALQYLQV